MTELLFDTYLKGKSGGLWRDEIEAVDRTDREFKFSVADWYNKLNNYFSYDGANTWFNARAFIKDADEYRNSFYNSRPFMLEEEHFSNEPSQELEDFLSGFSVRTEGGDE